MLHPHGAAGAQQVGSAGAQQVGSGAQHEGSAEQQELLLWKLKSLFRKQGFLQHELQLGAGAQQVGAAGAQHVGAAGAQQVGSGAQHVGSAEQHERLLWNRLLLNILFRKQGLLQHELQVGAGAQQVGSGAQQLGSDEQLEQLL